jgi:hypothetical protein
LGLCPRVVCKKSIERPCKRGGEENGENYMIRSFIICTFCQVVIGDRMDEDEITATCSTHGQNTYMHSFNLKT